MVENNINCGFSTYDYGHCKLIFPVRCSVVCCRTNCEEEISFRSLSYVGGAMLTNQRLLASNTGDILSPFLALFICV